MASIGVRREPTGRSNGLPSRCGRYGQTRPQAWRAPGWGGRLHGRRSGCCQLPTHLQPAPCRSAWRTAEGIRPVAAGELVRWADVVVDEADSAVRVRREMEQIYAAPPDMVVT